jgi:hypothetical protein
LTSRSFPFKFTAKFFRDAFPFAFKFKFNLNPNNRFFSQWPHEKDFFLLKFRTNFFDCIFINGKVEVLFFQRVLLYFRQRNQIFFQGKSFWRKDTLFFFSLLIWFVNLFRFNWHFL